MHTAVFIISAINSLHHHHHHLWLCVCVPARFGVWLTSVQPLPERSFEIAFWKVKINTWQAPFSAIFLFRCLCVCVYLSVHSSSAYCWMRRRRRNWRSVIWMLRNETKRKRADMRLLDVYTVCVCVRCVLDGESYFKFICYLWWCRGHNSTVSHSFACSVKAIQ